MNIPTGVDIPSFILEAIIISSFPSESSTGELVDYCRIGRSECLPRRRLRGYVGDKDGNRHGYCLVIAITNLLNSNLKNVVIL